MVSTPLLVFPTNEEDPCCYTNNSFSPRLLKNIIHV